MIIVENKNNRCDVCWENEIIETIHTECAIGSCKQQWNFCKNCYDKNRIYRNTDCLVCSVNAQNNSVSNLNTLYVANSEIVTYNDNHANDYCEFICDCTQLCFCFVITAYFMYLVSLKLIPSEF